MKKETLKEASHTAWLNYEHVEGNLYSTSFKNGFIDGAKWQAESMYSEAIDSFITEIKTEFIHENWDYLDFIKERVIEQFKKK